MGREHPGPWTHVNISNTSLYTGLKQQETRTNYDTIEAYRVACNLINTDQIYTKLSTHQANFILNTQPKFILISFRKK